MKRFIVVAGFLVALCGQASAQLSSGSGLGTITAGMTATSGITSGDIVGSTGNLAVDSGIAFANVATLSGTQTISGNKTFSGTVNFTGVPQVNSGTAPYGLAFNTPLGSAWYMTQRNLATGFPVPTMYPVANNSIIAMDLSPHGTGTDAGYGQAWTDICAQDVIVAAGALQCIHISAGTVSGFNIGSAEYTSGTIPDFNLGRLNGDTPAFTNSITILGTTGLVKFPIAIAMSGSVPTPTGTCAVNTQVGGNIAGTFKANGACAAGTVILTFATATSNGYACDAHDLTTPADAMNQTASTTTTATFTGSMVTLDVVAFKCVGF